ncbi:hypothetical protein NU08_1262 [Flavobacterium anhuiense]|uniref:Uncharacterized protein n=1 Tax=Flavobacterium anhuiense TaxID=459526 RepID=A0A444W1A3_9FLAO|nr:hypothetical protein NU08_1262 [Flavobacterium anhuiense]
MNLDFLDLYLIQKNLFDFKQNISVFKGEMVWGKISYH